MDSGEPDIRLERVTKRFGDMTAVDALDLEMPRGAFYALLGPSGCGKTTTLRMIGGFEEPTDGRVFLGGDDVTERPPYKRDVNTVFQSYALFPHLSVERNVALRARAAEGRQATRSARAPPRRSISSSSAHLGKRKPGQLSGGQQQRVALARALVNRPRALLLDEPLGALDLRLRKQLQIELKRIQQDVGITFVHVTHDQEEAMTMADTIAVMHDGRIEQAGGAADLYERPRTEFVANFLGVSNLIDGKLGADPGLASPRSRRTTARACTSRPTASARTTPTRSASACGPRRSRCARPATARARRRGELAARHRRGGRLPRRLDPVRGARAPAARSSPSSRRTSTARSRTRSGPAARSASPGTLITPSSSPRSRPHE